MSAPTKDEMFKRLCNAVLYWDKIDQQFFADNPTYFVTDIKNFANQIREYQTEYPESLNEDK